MSHQILYLIYWKTCFFLICPQSQLCHESFLDIPLFKGWMVCKYCANTIACQLCILTIWKIFSDVIECMYTSIRVSAGTHVGTCMRRLENYRRYHSQELSFFETGSLDGLELADWARWAGQWISGIPLSLPQSWGLSAHYWRLFKCRFWALNSGSLTEPSP